MNAVDALRSLWLQAGMPQEALRFVRLDGADPVLPSSFAVGAAAQSSIAAAALAACELGHQRGAARQTVSVDMTHAALECTGWFSVDGRVPQLWDAFAELQRRTTSAENAQGFFTTYARIDVTELAREITAPTLVLHARDDLRVPFSQAREIAAAIPGSRLIPLDSANHLFLPDEPAWAVVVREIEAFLSS